MENITVDKVIQKRIQLSDKMSELTKAYETEHAKLSKARDTLDLWLLQKAKNDGVQSFKACTGTAFVSSRLRPSCSDWEGLWNWMADTNNFSLHEKRLSVNAIKEYMEEHDGELPPGVNVFMQETVNVRRAG